MAARSDIEDFLSQKKLAVVGVSSRKRKFGNTVYRDLKAKGYEVFPIHRTAETVEGDACVSSLTALREKVDGVVVVVPPAESEKVVRDAAEAGISRIWMQLGADSEEAVRYCKEKGIAVIHKECILMFAEPAGFVHRFHRWLWGIFGKLPK